MEKLILVVHVLTALSIIGLILLQQGKGAEMGASFGAGASFFTRTTAILALLFFSTSFGLAVVAKQNATVASQVGIPTLQKSMDKPVEEEPDSDVPVVNDVEAEQSNDMPTVDDSTEDAAGDSDIPSVEEESPAQPQQ
ncbi:MAG: preprotein translocase subunit SecG [Exilibacterium sp.]